MTFDIAEYTKPCLQLMVFFCFKGLGLQLIMTTIIYLCVTIDILNN